MSNHNIIEEIKNKFLIEDDVDHHQHLGLKFTKEIINQINDECILIFKHHNDEGIYYDESKLLYFNPGNGDLIKIAWSWHSYDSWRDGSNSDEINLDIFKQRNVEYFTFDEYLEDEVKRIGWSIKGNYKYVIGPETRIIINLFEFLQTFDFFEKHDSNLIHSNDIKSQSIRIMDLNQYFNLDPKVFSEFLIKNPSICSNYPDNLNKCDRPNRYQAPCIIQRFEIPQIGSYSEYEEEVNWLVNNTNLAHYNDELKIFGNHEKKITKCENTDYCQIGHISITYIYNETHQATRNRYNGIELTYDQILQLWIKFYDDKLFSMLNHEYDSRAHQIIKDKCIKNHIHPAILVIYLNEIFQH